MGLLNSRGGVRNSGGGQGLSHVAVVATASGPQQLALLGNFQCGVGQYQELAPVTSVLLDDLARELAPATSVLLDDLAFSGLRLVAHLR